LGINSRDISWNYRNEHAFAIGTTHFNNQFHRLDAFHHVGYVGEAEQYLIKKIPLGELIEAFQPPMFKRPYTDENGIPFLSGIDLYNYYPKPHMFISRKMERLESYIVESGTILVQNVGQRYGLFGRPTIMPKHLSKCAITQHLMRVYPKDALNRGFVFIWLSTEIGRRLLLKNSFGTSMGVLFERSFTEMFCPDCSNDLRHSFEKDLETIVQMRDHANELEDQAQSILASGLELEE
jgi:type I restriction enzyme S subunit